MRSNRDFLVGILTGVAIGILTAPRSGKDTRGKLVDEANKRTDDLKDQWNKGVAQAKDQFDKVKQQANQYADQAKDKFDNVKGQAESEFNKHEVKSDYNNTVDELADDVKSGVNSAKESIKFD